MAGRPFGRSADDPLFEELKRWRDEAVRQSRVPLGAFKDTYLRSIARSGRTRADEIARMLPTSLRPFAGDIATRMQQLSAPRPQASPQPPAGYPPPQGYPPQGSPPTGAGPSTASGPSTGSGNVPDAPQQRPAQQQGFHPGSWRQPAQQPPTQQQPMGQQPVEQQSASGPSADRPTEPADSGVPAGPVPSPPDAAEAELLALAPHFAPYDYSGGGEVAGLRISTAGDGLAISWDPDPDAAEVTLYRLVAADDSYAPYAPEHADLVTVSTDCRAIDSRPFAAAIRQLQVWRNTGRTREEALASQPRLLAEGRAVAPVTDVQISEDQGRVIARWTTQPGVDRVHVYRIPAERASRGTDPQWRIRSSEANLGGFVDREGGRGRRYVYVFQSEATDRAATADGGTAATAVLSAPVLRPVSISADIVGITDLTVEQSGDEHDPAFELSWQGPPAGRVTVYRTQHGPRAGADGQLSDISALPTMGLPAEAQLTYPTERDQDGREHMVDVPWPPDWDRAYLTPVTVLDRQVKVGRTTPVVRVHQVSVPVLVERCDGQLIKFGWPSDAAAVRIQVTPPGGAPRPDGWTQEISRQRYDLLGGYWFARPLPGRGARVHLAGVSYTVAQQADAAGAPVSEGKLGHPVSLDYPGLLRLRYAVRIKRNLFRRVEGIGIQLQAETEVADRAVPPLVLVHRPDRMPLHPEDGTALQARPDIEEVRPLSRQFRPSRVTGQPADCQWIAPVKGLGGGYVRLFVDLPPEVLTRVALIDPPAAELQVP